MSWTPFLQAGAMAFFLGLGLLHPRVQQRLFISETWVNLMTGGLLFLPKACGNRCTTLVAEQRGSIGSSL